MEPFSEEELGAASMALRVAKRHGYADYAQTAILVQAELNRCKAALAVYERTKAQADANDRAMYAGLPAYRVSVLLEAKEIIEHSDYPLVDIDRLIHAAEEDDNAA